MGNIFINKLQCIYNSKYFTYYIYGLLFLICFFVMTGQNYGRYIPFDLAYIIDIIIWLCNILNGIVLFGLLYYIINIIKIIYKPSKIQFLILVLMVLSTYGLSSGIYIQSDISITDLCNYLWPASALMCYFYFLFNYIYNNRSVKLYEFIILIPIVILATNKEIGLVFVVMTIIWMIYHIIKNKTFDKYLLLLFIIGCISLLHSLLYSLFYIEKFVLEYTYAIVYTFFKNNYISTIFLLIILFIVINNQYKNKIQNKILLVPIFYTLFLYIILRLPLLREKIYFISNLENFVKKYIPNQVDEPYISVIIGTIMFLIVIFYILKVKWSSVKIKYLTYLLFLLVISSLLILSFSPTIYASFVRIIFILVVLYIIFIAMVFMESLKYINIKSKKFIIIFSLYFIVGIINMLSKVYR